MNEGGQFTVGGINLVTQPSKRREQSGLWSLVHPRHAGETVHTTAETKKCGEKPRCRPRIADEQLKGRLICSPSGDVPALPHD